MDIEEHFFTAAAEADFQSHFERYGDPIYFAIDQAIELLRRHPKSGPVYDEPVRRLVIRDTPLGLFYAVHGRRIAVVAILDLRQDPASIAKRLDAGG
ncbi:MAG: type II toxin-antitoxin system RelE/ParE family toxin [Verrucomicrobiales bacterium]|nr:type II toxin-antitoxin system RelE/ParE family toxin [Verrucomicrobiales bacterium]